MKRIALTLLLLSFGLCLLGCSKDGQGPKIDWPKMASCAEGGQTDLIISVQKILLGDGDNADSTISERAVSQFEALAQKHGSKTVACVVDQAIIALATPKVTAPPAADSQGKMRGFADIEKGEVAEPAPTDRAAAARGRDFLERIAKTDIQRDAGHPE